MYFNGIIIGLSAFVIIGAFHPIVIKAEYYFSISIWPFFLISGILFCLLSVLTENIIAGSILGIIGFTCLWSILELIHQKKRVEKGWFPSNPNRKK